APAAIRSDAGGREPSSGAVRRGRERRPGQSRPRRGPKRLLLRPAAAAGARSKASPAIPSGRLGTHRISALAGRSNRRGDLRAGDGIATVLGVGREYSLHLVLAAWLAELRHRHA